MESKMVKIKTQIDTPSHALMTEETDGHQATKLRPVSC